MTEAPRLITTLGLPRKVELALMRQSLFSVEQLKSAGDERINKIVGPFGLRSIKRQLKRTGAELPVPLRLGTKAPNRDAEIQRLYLAGETLQSIGEIFDLSRERVRQLLKQIFPPEALKEAKQTHDDNYYPPHVIARKYLLQIAEGCTQATFINQKGIPRDILISFLPEVNEVIKAKRGRGA